MQAIQSWAEWDWSKSRQHFGAQNTWTGNEGNVWCQVSEISDNRVLCQRGTSKCFDTDGKWGVFLSSFICLYLCSGPIHVLLSTAHAITPVLNEKKWQQQIRGDTDYGVKISERERDKVVWKGDGVCAGKREVKGIAQIQPIKWMFCHILLCMQTYNWSNNQTFSQNILFQVAFPKFPISEIKSF